MKCRRTPFDYLIKRGSFLVILFLLLPPLAAQFCSLPTQWNPSEFAPTPCPDVLAASYNLPRPAKSMLTLSKLDRIIQHTFLAFFMTSSSRIDPWSSPAIASALSTSRCNCLPLSLTLTILAQISSALPFRAGSKTFLSSFNSFSLSISSALSSAYPRFLKTWTLAANFKHCWLSLICFLLHSTARTDICRSCFLSKVVKPLLISCKRPWRMTRCSCCNSMRLPSSKKPLTITGIDPGVGLLRKASSHFASSSRGVGL